MNDEGDIDSAGLLLEEGVVLQASGHEPPVVEPEDDEVPPWGVLAPDPTGLGALA
ncbi:MAG: hypothetical protein JWN68_222 [Nocardioides sp.]|jgi:hypothetical protein|uniref:hypothetical protein n=1 Tax=Nocardioides sp. TaxID=35761 RepID=UPI00261FCB5F|nr:hypothetical protein [Nocardioides sp.]MCW2832269.1 hypothetical protein [Nocardioides sp.]